MQKFLKVSLAQFRKDFASTFNIPENDPLIQSIYDEIMLPKRATIKSAGYDFFSPIYFCLKAGESIKIPTGIRCLINEDWFLSVFPRSSLGCKYKLHFDNVVPIIDSDYFQSDNEGHIFLQFSNNGSKDITVNMLDRICQGIFIQYGKTVDDDASAVRNGGFGSTNEYTC